MYVICWPDVQGRGCSTNAHTAPANRGGPACRRTEASKTGEELGCVLLALEDLQSQPPTDTQLSKVTCQNPPLPSEVPSSAASMKTLAGFAVQVPGAPVRGGGRAGHGRRARAPGGVPHQRLPGPRAGRQPTGEPARGRLQLLRLRGCGNVRVLTWARGPTWVVRLTSWEATVSCQGDTFVACGARFDGQGGCRPCPRCAQVRGLLLGEFFGLAAAKLTCDPCMPVSSQRMPANSMQAVLTGLNRHY